MDRIEAMRAFVSVVEERGFAPAARHLGLSPPAVTRAVAALERRLGTRLLHRTSRALRLTGPGSRFFADCKRILGELDEAESAATGSHSAARGRLAVTAPLLFGRLHVTPIVLEFLALHPQLSVRTFFADHVLDLLEEEMDVAIRIGRLPASSSLRALRVGSVRRVLCGSPEYLSKHGTPLRPSDLAHHQLIAFAGLNPTRSWTFVAQGKPLVVAPAPRLSVNTADTAIAAAVAGHGLARVLSYQVEAELRARALSVVLAEYEPPASPVQVVHAEGKSAPARVRGFVDLAVTRLRRLLASSAA